MTARLSICGLLVSLLAISGGPAFGQYASQQPNPQYQPSTPQQYSQPAAQQYPPGNQPYQPPAAPQYQQPPGQQYRQPAPAQQYSQPAGPQRPIYPAQPAAQGAYQPSPGEPMPPGASAIVPQDTPTLQRRAPLIVNAPFQLTPAEQAELDAVLKRWEEASRKHKRIAIEFDRFEYKPTFKPDGPLHTDKGNADFTSDGKWLWNISADGPRAERMLFDGEAIYEFNYSSETVTKHVLDKNVKGEDMVRAMLPFLFGTDMKVLKDRYWIRLLKFPALAETEVCIDAYPRYQEEAKNYMCARMIVDMKKMEPTGLMILLPNGKDKYSYNFTKVDINPRNPLDLINDPFKVKVPSGWKTYVEQIPGPEVTNRPAAGPVR